MSKNKRRLQYTELTTSQKELYNRLVYEISKCMNWTNEKSELWMHAENLNFGGTSPIFLIASGRGQKVESFVLNSLYSNTN